MFGKKIVLFKILGFTVSLDLSWFLIFVLVAWSLAMSLFPAYFGDLSTLTYWLMGIAGALGLFLSVVFHELTHSLVARRFGLPMRGITLFVFGGVAEMQDEPPSPKAEFVMAVAGPLSSGALALFFFGASSLMENGVPASVYGVARYLAFINGALALFNLLPAFPLDGGRMLRSALWRWKKSLKTATYIASRIGLAFGAGIIALGVVSFLFFGNFVGGMWWFLIGMFLIHAARSSYQHLILRKALEGERVSRFMKSDPVTVPPNLSVQQLVEDYFYKYHFKLFPVVEKGRLVGCVSTKQLKNIPRNEWKERPIGDIIDQCSDENSVSPDTDAVKVLGTMNRKGVSRLMVTDDGELQGIISLKDMLKFISLRVELEER